MADQLTCSISIEDVPDEIIQGYFSSVNIKRVRSGMSNCTLNLSIPANSEGSVDLFDEYDLRPWKQIDVQVIFDDNTYHLFSGFVTDIQARYQDDQIAVLVDCKDNLIQMRRQTRMFIWGEGTPQTGTEIVTNIAADYDFQTSVYDERSFTGRNQNMDDLRFLTSLAQERFAELRLEPPNLLVMQDPLQIEDSQPDIDFRSDHSGNCQSISISDDASQADFVILQTLQDEQLINEEIYPDVPILGSEAAEEFSSSLGSDFTFRFPSLGNESENARLEALQKANQLTWKITCQGSLDGYMYGRPLDIGRKVNVSGIGDTYSGEYYVHSVEHSIETGQWTQNFSLLRNGRK